VSIHSWIRPSRRLLLLFLGVTLLPSMGLIWLGWHLLQQDRALMDQRIQERRERAADLLVAALEQKLLATEQNLNESFALQNAAPGDDALLVVFRPGGIDAYPKTRLLYYPSMMPGKEAPGQLFRRGEEYEFRLQDYANAIASFRELAHSGDVAVRAGAQLRLARNLRKAGQFGAALAAYQELAQLGAVSIGGVAVELLARRARCALLAELKRNEELQREAGALYADLCGGRWQLGGAVYFAHAQDISDWIKIDRKTEQGRLALAAGTEWLWEKWQAIAQGESRGSGRQSMDLEGRLVTLLWKAMPDRLLGFIAGPDYVERQWLAGLRTILEARGVQLSLRDPDGRTVLGVLPPLHAQQAQRATLDTGLPWTLLVAAADPQSDIDQLAARRRLLLAGLALVTTLVCAGSYFTARAFMRELAAARLQSDFVAAVSHEFRTPLASLRQLTENLLDGRVTSEERRNTYYQAQSRATARLNRLVEGLLDFGRMEAGVLRYRLEPINASELVRSVTDEFQQESAECDHHVELSMDGELPAICGDREALTRALWNLLDNAVKYSPGSPTVLVEVAREQDGVSISVRDRGLGITPEEQKQIFRKFFRGSAAKAAGVKGTGIGLAMVQHIIQAHGGKMRLESAPGVGSTFTIVLPVSTT